MLNRWHSNLSKLKAQGRDHNPLFMHPDGARPRQIADGDRVCIANRFGTLQALVKLSAQLMPGVVAMAQGWCSVASPEYEKMRVLSDPHSPNKFRVNGTVANLPEFGQAFSCQVGTKMRPEKPCEVW